MAHELFLIELDKGSCNQEIEYIMDLLIQIDSRIFLIMNEGKTIIAGFDKSFMDRLKMQPKILAVDELNCQID